MTIRDQAVKIARDMDLRAKAGIWFKAKERDGDWCVVRVDSETDKERVVRRVGAA